MEMLRDSSGVKWTTALLPQYNQSQQLKQPHGKLSSQELMSKLTVFHFPLAKYRKHFKEWQTGVLRHEADMDTSWTWSLQVYLTHKQTSTLCVRARSRCFWRTGCQGQLGAGSPHQPRCNPIGPDCSCWEGPSAAPDMARNKTCPGSSQKLKRRPCPGSTRGNENLQHSSGKVYVSRPWLKWSSQPRGRRCGWPGEACGCNEGLPVHLKPWPRGAVLNSGSRNFCNVWAMTCRWAPVPSLRNSSSCSFDYNR